MSEWAEASDVTGAWIGPDAPDDDDLIETWIGKAEREIRRQVPDIRDRLAAESDLVPPVKDLAEDVTDVIVAMVSRVFRNPAGTRQVTESIGAGPLTESVNRTFAGDVPGGLAPTDKELAKLQGTRSDGAFTISMIPAHSPFAGG